MRKTSFKKSARICIHKTINNCVNTVIFAHNITQHVLKIDSKFYGKKMETKIVINKMATKRTAILDFLDPLFLDISSQKGTDRNA